MSDAPEADWSTLGVAWAALILIQFGVYIFLYLGREVSLWYIGEPLFVTFVVLALFFDDDRRTTWAWILFAYALLATIGKFLWAWANNDLNLHTAHTLYHFVEFIVIATAFRGVILAMAEREAQGGSERAGAIARERRLAQLLRRQEIAKTARRVSRQSTVFEG